MLQSDTNTKRVLEAKNDKEGRAKIESDMKPVWQKYFIPTYKRIEADCAIRDKRLRQLQTV
jgi:hypothetical protein